jgi:hypothetical protein
MAEDIYVFEDQGWYGLVTLDGGYLLVYFLWDWDITSVVRDIVWGICQCRMYFFSLKNCTRRLCRTGASFVRFHLQFCFLPLGASKWLFP